MTMGLAQLYESLRPEARAFSNQGYVAAPVPRFSRYLVGADQAGAPCLLITTDAGFPRTRAPIRLANLAVRYAARSLVRARNDTSEGTFTIIQCTSTNADVVRYFLALAETLIRLIGTEPTEIEISQAVSRFAIIFQRLTEAPSRTLDGLFAELFVIATSREPRAALSAWRSSDASRFDFSSGSARMDVKATSGRLRIHTFSYDQCNPPLGTTAIIASMFVERISEGLSLRSLIEDIEANVASSPELVFKLNERVAQTMGSAINDALAACFDARLARSSLRFYDLRTVPAIRGDLPPGVGDVHFRSDLSLVEDVAVVDLCSACADIARLLPEY